jgi:hypothetical protein
MRPLLAVFLLLPLSGCFSDQKAAAARCTATAKAQHPRSIDQTEEEYTDALGNPITTCMKTAGYSYYPDQPDCDALASNPYCYYPKDHARPKHEV